MVRSGLLEAAVPLYLHERLDAGAEGGTAARDRGGLDGLEQLALRCAVLDGATHMSDDAVLAPAIGEDTDDDHLAVLDRELLALAHRQGAQRPPRLDVLGIFLRDPVPERVAVRAGGLAIDLLRASAHRGLLGLFFLCSCASAGGAPAPRRPAAHTASLRLGRRGPSPATACGAHRVAAPRPAGSSPATACGANSPEGITRLRYDADAWRRAKGRGDSCGGRCPVCPSFASRGERATACSASATATAGSGASSSCAASTSTRGSIAPPRSAASRRGTAAGCSTSVPTSARCASRWRAGAPLRRLWRWSRRPTPSGTSSKT